MAKSISLSIASSSDRNKIYCIRHSIYAEELNQHPARSSNMLKDDLDSCNHYIVAKSENDIVGFISITPPAAQHFSVDKYFPRTVIPFAFDEHLYEIRLLTVIRPERNSFVAAALMYAAFRWVQSHGGKHIIAICRQDILGMYLKAGLQLLHHRTQSGKVVYELAFASIDELQDLLRRKPSFVDHLYARCNWYLPYLFLQPAACYHGGMFFKALGEDLQTLEKASAVISADVLDAWFAPSPKVVKAIDDHLIFLLQTSPPTYAEGLIKVIAEMRGVKECHVLPGAGSSDLIFLGLTHLLTNQSKVLIIDPCYGEYIHVLENVVQCQINRFVLSRTDGFKVAIDSLLNELQKGYDLVILVNPNSPTGVYTPKQDMVHLLPQIPKTTLVWIDETYIDYVGSSDSLEKMAVTTENVLICKSMSKVYALSGVRAAYACGPAHLIERLRLHTPPWAVSLPAQAAAIAALQDDAYYSQQYKKTHELREKLIRELQGLGVTEIVAGVANFVMFYLPSHFPEVDTFLSMCISKGLYIRNVGNMGSHIGNSAMRIAVKDEATNKKMIGIIKEVIIADRS